jgi:signal transduction histidine kinase
LNASVFAAVLITFSLSVFAVFIDKLEQDTKSDLRHLADAVIASIDFDEDSSKSPASAEPDLIASAMPINSTELLNALKLQWFDYKGKFVLEKGSFDVRLPLNREESFVTLQKPRGIIYSKPAIADGVLLGYVRVAIPLDKQDRAVANLQLGLTLGTLAALIVSAVGMALLVRQSILPLRRSIKQLRQFTVDASHDLRTPIMAICSNSSVALKYPENIRPGDKEKFEMIQQSGLQMKRLVDDLLLLSAIERKEGAKENSLHSANLLAEVKQSLAILSWLTATKQTNIEITVAENIELAIPADDLRRVISNLLENAIRHTEVGGTIKIRCITNSNTTSGAKETSINLQIEDDGDGINSQDIDKVFDRFWRADKARTLTQGQGYCQGLGLAITKELVNKNNGTISVESELGKGSTFTVCLKLA